MIAPIEDNKHAAEVRHARERSYGRPAGRQQDDSNKVMRFSRQMIASHPVAALAVAAVVGLSAGMLIKRRH